MDFKKDKNLFKKIYLRAYKIALTEIPQKDIFKTTNKDIWEKASKDIDVQKNKQKTHIENFADNNVNKKISLLAKRYTKNEEDAAHKLNIEESEIYDKNLSLPGLMIAKMILIVKKIKDNLLPMIGEMKYYPDREFNYKDYSENNYSIDNKALELVNEVYYKFKGGNDISIFFSEDEAEYQTAIERFSNLKKKKYYTEIVSLQQNLEDLLKNYPKKHKHEKEKLSQNLLMFIKQITLRNIAEYKNDHSTALIKLKNLILSIENDSNKDLGEYYLILKKIISLKVPANKRRTYFQNSSSKSSDYVTIWDMKSFADRVNKNSDMISLELDKLIELVSEPNISN